MDNVFCGAFESIRIHHGMAVALKDHIQRLYASLNFLGIEEPGSQEQLFLQTETFLKATQPTADVEKLNIFYDQNLGLSFKRSPSSLDGVFRLTLGADTLPRSANDEHKLLGAFSRYVKTLVPAGFDDSLLHQDGYLLETRMANVFFVKSHTLYSPVHTGVLQGLMRKRVLNYAASKRINTVCRPILLSELESFEEIFLTNAVRGIIRVSEVEGFLLKSGEITEQIRLELNA
jgi:4-amino-4-deoxychorismate lyase